MTINSEIYFINPEPSVGGEQLSISGSSYNYHAHICVRLICWWTGELINHSGAQLKYSQANGKYSNCPHSPVRIRNFGTLENSRYFINLILFGIASMNSYVFHKIDRTRLKRMSEKNTARVRKIRREWEKYEEKFVDKPNIRIGNSESSGWLLNSMDSFLVVRIPYKILADTRLTNNVQTAKQIFYMICNKKIFIVHA